MSAVVVPLRRRGGSRSGWSSQELASFYRVIEILGQSHLVSDIDTGVSDEGDPWLVIYRADTQDVILHFAWIDGVLIAATAATGEVISGYDLGNLLTTLTRRQPSLFRGLHGNGQSVYLHPIVVLAGFVAAAYLSLSPAGAGAEEGGAEQGGAEEGGAEQSGAEQSGRLPPRAAKPAGEEARAGAGSGGESGMPAGPAQLAAPHAAMPHAATPHAATLASVMLQAATIATGLMLAIGQDGAMAQDGWDGAGIAIVEPALAAPPDAAPPLPVGAAWTGPGPGGTGPGGTGPGGTGPGGTGPGGTGPGGAGMGGAGLPEAGHRPAVPPGGSAAPAPDRLRADLGDPADPNLQAGPMTAGGEPWPAGTLAAAETVTAGLRDAGPALDLQARQGGQPQAAGTAAADAPAAGVHTAETQAAGTPAAETKSPAPASAPPALAPPALAPPAETAATLPPPPVVQLVRADGITMVRIAVHDQVFETRPAFEVRLVPASVIAGIESALPPAAPEPAPVEAESDSVAEPALESGEEPVPEPGEEPVPEPGAGRGEPPADRLADGSTRIVAEATHVLTEARETVVFRGGQATLAGFEQGVDRLIIDADRVAVEGAEAVRQGDAILVRFRDGSTLTLLDELPAPPGPQPASGAVPEAGGAPAAGGPDPAKPAPAALQIGFADSPLAAMLKVANAIELTLTEVPESPAAAPAEPAGAAAPAAAPADPLPPWLGHHHIHAGPADTLTLTPAAEAVFFRGNHLTIRNFHLGVDVLVVDKDVVDESSVTVQWQSPVDLTIAFGSESSITLIGLIFDNALV